jgi:hypothetical protein
VGFAHGAWSWMQQSNSGQHKGQQQPPKSWHRLSWKSFKGLHWNISWSFFAFLRHRLSSWRQSYDPASQYSLWLQHLHLTPHKVYKSWIWAKLTRPYPEENCHLTKKHCVFKDSIHTSKECTMFHSTHSSRFHSEGLGISSGSTVRGKHITFFLWEERN